MDTRFNRDDAGYWRGLHDFCQLLRQRSYANCRIFSLISDVFLRLIKMLIGPLVFSTLVVGIAHIGDAKSVGRIFFRVFAWFVIASAVSLLLGIVMANLLQPGHNLGLPLPAIDAAADLKTSSFTLRDFVIHLVPKSFAEALANNEILQIVVFSLFLAWRWLPWGMQVKR